MKFNMVQFFLRFNYGKINITINYRIKLSYGFSYNTNFFMIFLVEFFSKYRITHRDRRFEINTGVVYTILDRKNKQEKTNPKSL
jgi:hypothetical protein